MVTRNLGISNYKSSWREFGSEVTRKIQSCCYDITTGISSGQVEQIVTITRINLVFVDAATIKSASSGYLSVKGR
jgi:hypothetical protein